MIKSQTLLLKQVLQTPKIRLRPCIRKKRFW